MVSTTVSGMRMIALAAAVSAVLATASTSAQEVRPVPTLPPALPAPPDAQQADVPVRLVVLYSSGVGYFEHHGTVDGTAATELRFKTDQINDLLKSLVLQDLDKGQVSTITYPSQDPLAKLLKSFQVDVSGNLSRADLLQQLRGAQVTCHLQDGKEIRGTVLGVEIEKVPTGEKGDLQEIPTLNLLNEQGATNVRLPAVQFVSFDDKRLQDELNKALAALVQARDQDKKAVVFQFVGEGKRRVKIGYVVEAPVWKTSYRLLLDNAPDQKPFIQGWAIVENQTDTDWNNVQLSLVSGRPVSFVQDLYQPLYIPRPVFQPELFASLKPREYEEGMDKAKRLPEEAAKQQLGGVNGMTMGRFSRPAVTGGSKMALRNSAAAVAGEDAIGHNVERESLASPMTLAATQPQLDQLYAAGIASSASSANLGDLFQYTVSVPVTLTRQKSAMLPIIADDIQAQRVSIYNAATLARYPLSGAILTNSTGKHLLNGPITVFENGAYGGDARISDLPPGQQRLISYGIDLKVLADSTSVKQEQTIQAGKIAKGVLQIATKVQFTQEYKFENKGDKDKAIIIEHPLRANWTLVTPDKPMEKTDALYRFKLAAAAGKPAALTVQEENTIWQAMAILPFDLDQLLFYARNGKISQPVRDALAKAATLKQFLVQTQRNMDQTRQKIAQTSAQQQSTRENMKAIAPQAQASDYYNRLLKRLSDQDSQLDTLQKTLDDLQQQYNTRQKELEDYLSDLNVQ